MFDKTLAERAMLRGEIDQAAHAPNPEIPVFLFEKIEIVNIPGTVGYNNPTIFICKNIH